ncbi:MAG: 3-hydroxyacyl-ACP dehydratase FabZ [Desulfofustis sp.]|nr:3-hydroxyacyl-ACP dehydratase FabZ [Desulfofustis sp.]MBT8347629.1 3-hydroxyacyl-ACP dehydratase FabZ [Desulfofustis sp.]NNF46144.1 3-hydroxyacyl-ACP dehydratase FabZ [Desulfofustis sp.]NNK56761.1 3-hydroxyacyl-ACP dehydratase FabZ [Desulfofustis sp.]
MEDIVKKKEIDIQEIMRLLPHRYPFLLVDRIISLIPSQSVTGLKNVTANEPCFQGHFPGQPIFPGVLILEGMAQTGGCMAFCSIPEMIGEKLIYFAGIDKARFRKPVVPGDQIEYRLQMLRQKRMVMVMKGQAFVDDQLVTEAELMASFV